MDRTAASLTLPPKKPSIPSRHRKTAPSSSLTSSRSRVSISYRLTFDHTLVAPAKAASSPPRHQSCLTAILEPHKRGSLASEASNIHALEDPEAQNTVLTAPYKHLETCGSMRQRAINLRQQQR